MSAVTSVPEGGRTVSKCHKLSALLALILFTFVPHSARADAYDSGMDAYQTGAYAQALLQWKTLSEHGHAQAAYNLGFMYEFGYGVAPNDTEAFNYYLRAAQQGHAQAQHTVAWMYQRGKGVQADRAQAARWLDISASSGKAANDIDVQEFVEQLAAELKNASARYDAQKATQQNPPVEFEASNQIS